MGAWRHIWARVSASIGKRGLIASLPLIGSRLWDLTFDLRYPTDSSFYAQLEDLGIASEHKQRGVRYEPTRARPLRTLLRRLDLPTSSGFVDVGCGKGRVLMIAAEYGFKRVVGVEFSRELCETARSNLATYARQTGAATDFVVIHQDAADYEFKPDGDVLFFFNSFDDVVMAKVVDNIRHSVSRFPTDVTLIYYNPLCWETVEAANIFEKPTDYRIGGCHFAVYRRSRTHPD